MSGVEQVVAECPLCSWLSIDVPVGDGPNAEWHARTVAAAEYRKHFDARHRPLPRFVAVSRDYHFGGHGGGESQHLGPESAVPRPPSINEGDES